MATAPAAPSPNANVAHFATKVFKKFASHEGNTPLMPLDKFRSILLFYGVKETNIEPYFHAMQAPFLEDMSWKKHKGGMAEKEFVTGFTALSPLTPHSGEWGRVRLDFIFEQYADSSGEHSGLITKTGYSKMVTDIVDESDLDPEAKVRQEEEARKSVQQFGSPKSKADFVQAVVNHKFRGTSKLFRFKRAVDPLHDMHNLELFLAGKLPAGSDDDSKKTVHTLPVPAKAAIDVKRPSLVLGKESRGKVEISSKVVAAGIGGPVETISTLPLSISDSASSNAGAPRRPNQMSMPHHPAAFKKISHLAQSLRPLRSDSWGDFADGGATRALQKKTVQELAKTVVDAILLNDQVSKVYTAKLTAIHSRSLSASASPISPESPTLDAHRAKVEEKSREEPVSPMEDVSADLLNPIPDDDEDEETVAEEDGDTDVEEPEHEHEAKGAAKMHGFPTIGRPNRAYAYDVLTVPELLALCESAQELFAKDPVLVEVACPVKVFGDIHGQLLELLDIFRQFGSPNHYRGDIRFVSYLFNGDFVDRSPLSLEVISLLFSLKVLYPDSIFLVRGNHEDRAVNRLYGFLQECEMRLPRLFAERVWNAVNTVFDWLPLGAVINDSILVVHGGVGGELQSLAQIRAVKRPVLAPQEHSQLLRDVLWSDPVVHDKVVGVHASARGFKIYQYDADRVRQFCKDNKLEVIIRSHQCVPAGYEFFAGGHLITVFSATNYCGKYANNGAFLEIFEKREPRQSQSSGTTNAPNVSKLRIEPRVVIDHSRK